MRPPTHLAHKQLIPLLLGLTMAGSPCRGDVVTFEDLTVPQDGYYNGNPGNLSPGDEVSQPWSSGGASFDNTFGIDASFGFSYWSGFAYSDVVDSTTAGFGNQYAAYPGSGYLSPTYAVAYADGAAFRFPSAATVSGFRIANTTYAYLAMQDGDSFTSPLTAGGWFEVQASGSLAGSSTGSVTFALADLRGGSPPGILASWAWFDLSPLGTVDQVSFTFTGSDTGTFGLNTPAYFAMDDLAFTAVPEPAGWVFVATATTATLLWQRRRNRWTRNRRGCH